MSELHQWVTEDWRRVIDEMKGEIAEVMSMRELVDLVVTREQQSTLASWLW